MGSVERREIIKYVCWCVWVGNSCDESQWSGNYKYVLRHVLPILCSCGDPCVQSVGSGFLVCTRVHTS